MGMKDAVAARIYDQLSRSLGWLGESKEEDNERMSAMNKKDYAVCELTLALDDHSAKSVSKALARAPRQLQNVNDDKRLPGFFLLQTETGIFVLGYVPDEMQDRLCASDWVLHSLS